MSDFLPTLPDIENIKKISNIRKYVIEEIVQPNYIRKIKSAFKWQHRWAIVYGASLGFAKLMLLVVTLLSFLASFLDNKYVALAAGACGVFGTGLIQYSSFARAKSRDGVADINKLLYDLGIKGIPDIYENDEKILSDNASDTSQMRETLKRTINETNGIIPSIEDDRNTIISVDNILPPISPEDISLHNTPPMSP
jgi:hypothetical protein